MALDLPFPGGDACTADVVRGLAKLRRRLAMTPSYVTRTGEHDNEELAALGWIAMWVEAGAAMLPTANENEATC